MKKLKSLQGEEQKEKLWAALKKHGINNEEELKEALKKMKPINIGCMTKKRNNQEAII